MSAKTSNGGTKTRSRQAAAAAKAETAPRRGAAAANAAPRKKAPKADAGAADKAAKATAESAEQAVKASAETVEQLRDTGEHGLDGPLEAGNQTDAQGVDQAMQLTMEQIGRYHPDAIVTFDQLAMVHQDNVEAFFAAQAAAAKGVEAIGEELLAFNRKTVDAGFETMKALFGVSSVQDAIELQSGFARERLEDFVAGSAKLSELTLKVSKEAAEPISARLSRAVEQATKPVAR